MKSSYVKPEIRVDKIHETDFIETIKTNRSTKMEDPDSLNFVYSDHISSKGKKFAMLLDQHGYMNYFFTRNFKQFAFFGRFFTGGYPDAQPKIKEVVQYG